MWKTMWIMCITCCREKLLKILCECIEQMTIAGKSRELCITTQKDGRFSGKFVKMVGGSFLPEGGEICGADRKRAGQSARKAAKYGGLSDACFSKREGILRQPAAAHL